MSELVRVKLPSGGEATVGEAVAKKHKLEVLDKPALIHGRALDPTPPPETSDAPAPVGTTPTPAGDKPARPTKES